VAPSSMLFTVAFVRGTPFAALVPVRQAAEAVIALYLGMEMLMHLDGDLASPESFFASAEQAATLLDALRI
jgi:hypothetical protein